MGLLRVILAMMVVFAHRGPIGGAGWVLHGGAFFAVKAFFMVSGFYMALILHDRYRRLPVRDFYLSRLLRLLPIYWTIGALTVLAEFLLVPRDKMFYSLDSPLYYWTGPLGLNFRGIPAGLWAYIGVSDLTLLGSDSWLWLGFSRIDGALSLAPGYGPAATAGNGLSPVPQAWSIGCELWFYLIAPFVTRRLWLVFVLAGGSLLTRYLMARCGFSGEPWKRAFFPSELIYFLLGVLAYRVYLHFPGFQFPERGRSRYVGLTLLAVYAVAPVSLLANHIGPIAVLSDLLDIVPYALLFLVLPCLFRATEHSALDGRIGELSYPLYISHNFVYGLLAAIPLDLNAFFGRSWGWALFNAAAVIAVAFAIDRWLALPIDKFRRRFGARAPERVEPTPDGGAISVT